MTTTRTLAELDAAVAAIEAETTRIRADLLAHIAETEAEADAIEAHAADIEAGNAHGNVIRCDECGTPYYEPQPTFGGLANVCPDCFRHVTR